MQGLTISSGTVARTMAQVFIHPIDTYKTRQQVLTPVAAQQRAAAAARPPPPPGAPTMLVPLRERARVAALLSGVRSMYLGLTGAVVGTIPTALLYFSCYEATSAALRRHLPPGAAHEGVVSLAAAGCGAAVSALARVPGDVVRHRVQVGEGVGGRGNVVCVGRGGRGRGGQGACSHALLACCLGASRSRHPPPTHHTTRRTASIAKQAAHSSDALCLSAPPPIPPACCPQVYQYRNIWHAAASILRCEGVRGLYRGFSTTMLRDAPEIVLQFTSYKWLQGTLRDAGWLAALQPNCQHILLGAASGALAAGLTSPLDAIKVQMQCSSTRRDVVGTAAAILRRSGPAGLLAGCGPRLLQCTLASAVFFVLFEELQQRGRAWAHDSASTTSTGSCSGSACSPSSAWAPGTEDSGTSWTRGTATLRVLPLRIAGPVPLLGASDARGLLSAHAVVG